MAMNSMDSPKRLFELLEEKQEPFVLEIYLLERGCKFLKKSPKYHSRNSTVRKSSVRFSSIVKSLYNKILVVNNGVLKLKHGSDSKRRRRKDKEIAESGRTSTTSCSTLSNAWPESDTEVDSMSSPASTTTYESAPKIMMAHRRLKEHNNKQCIPASFLDEIDLLQAIPVYNVRQNREAATASGVIRFQKSLSDDSILSASSLWEMLVQARKQKSNNMGSKSFRQYIYAKKALLKTRRLLFDSVREVAEHKNNATDDKIKCNNLKPWGKLSANETSTKKLLRMDLLGDEEWFCFEEWKRELAIEIGNGVVEGITDEIVRDMFVMC